MLFVNNFFRNNDRDIGVSGRELAVLSVVEANRVTGICAADLVTAIEIETGKEPRLMTVYETLISLEEKGLIKELRRSNPDKGGRKRRIFTISDIGSSALVLGKMISSR